MYHFILDYNELHVTFENSLYVDIQDYFSEDVFNDNYILCVYNIHDEWHLNGYIRWFNNLKKLTNYDGIDCLDIDTYYTQIDYNRESPISLNFVIIPKNSLDFNPLDEKKIDKGATILC